MALEQSIREQVNSSFQHWRCAWPQHIPTCLTCVMTKTKWRPAEGQETQRLSDNLARGFIDMDCRGSVLRQTHTLFLPRVGRSIHLLLISFFSSCCSLSEVRVFCLDHPFWTPREDAALWYECDNDLCVEITEMWSNLVLVKLACLWDCHCVISWVFCSAYLGFIRAHYEKWCNLKCFSYLL